MKKKAEISDRVLQKRAQAVIAAIEENNCVENTEKLKELLFDLLTRQSDLEREDKELRRREEERAAREVLLWQKVILDNIPDMAWLKDRDGKFIIVNQPFARACGSEPEEIEGKTDLQVWPEHLARKYMDDDRDIMSKGHRKQIEEPLADKEGRIQWIETIKTPIVDERGKVLGTAGIARDITKKRKIQQTLRASYRQIEQIKLEWELSVDSLHELLFLLDRNYRIIRMNRSVEAWGLGSPAELKGKGLHELLHRRCEDPRCYMKTFFLDSVDSIEHQKEMVWEGEDEVLAKHVLIRIRPFLDRDKAAAGGSQSFAVAVIYDISERKESERRLQDAFRKLSEVQGQLIHTAKMAAVGQLASSVVHEIKNPLAIILGGMEYLDSSLDLDPALKEVSTMVKSATMRADKIVKELLGFARQKEAVFREVDIASVIDEGLSLVEHQIGLRNIRIVREFASSAPKVLVDPDKMKQVVINLAVNAVDAMTPEGGTLTLRIALQDDRVHIAFSDTGCGIGKAALEKVFDPFYTTKEESNSAGLGLPITRQIVEAHYGAIRVESEPGKGTTFVIELPAENGEHRAP